MARRHHISNPSLDHWLTVFCLLSSVVCRLSSVLCRLSSASCVPNHIQRNTTPHPPESTGDQRFLLCVRENKRESPVLYQIGHADNETIVQVKTLGNPVDLAPAVEKAIHEVDGRIPVFDVRSMREAT